MAGGHIEFLAADMRGHDGQIAQLGLLAAQEVLEGVAHDGAAGQPQRKAESYPAGEGEEFHLLAQLAVIPFLGLLEHLKILVEHALLGEGDAVDTGKLLTVLIPFPVGAGYGGKLYSLDVVNVLDVRATAQVGETAVFIEGNGSTL